MPLSDTSLLTAALAGYQQRRADIDQKIAEIERQLGWRGLGRRTNGVPAGVDSKPIPRKRRRMSAAARARIAQAQKKRWAAFHAKQTGGGARATKMAAGRKRGRGVGAKRAA